MTTSSGAANRLRTPVLGDDHVADFHRDGYVVLRGGFNVADMKRIERWTRYLAELPEKAGKHWVYHEKNLLDPATELIGRIENNTLDNGVERGISVTSDTASVDLGTIDNNTINRIIAGTDSVWISGVDSSLSATLIRNRITGDSFNNIDTAAGISVFSSGGNLVLVVGQDDPAFPGALTFGNIFDGNLGSAIRVELQDNGSGALGIYNNTIISTIDDAALEQARCVGGARP